MSAQQYGMDPNQFAQALDQQGQVPAVMSEVARRKALAAILDQVKVLDTTGAEVDLDALDDSEDDAEGSEGPADEIEDVDTVDTVEDEAPAKS